VWFDWPKLRFVHNPSVLVNLVELTLPFTARLRDRFDEAIGTLTARPSLVQTTVASGGGQLTAPMIDFRSSASDAFALDINVEDYREPVMAAMVSSLRDISPFTAAPLFPDTGRQFFFRTYEDVLAGIDPGMLCIFIDDGGSPPALPSTVVPNDAWRLKSVGLVPRDRVEVEIQAGLVKQGLDHDHLPAPVPGQDGLTMTALAIEWHNEFFLITGEVEADVGPFTNTVTFTAWVHLAVEDAKVTVRVVRTDQDGDWLLDVIDFLSAGAITRLLEEVIPRAVSSVGGSAFGSLSMFAEAVPSEQAFAAVRPSGNIGIFLTGLSIPVVPATVESISPPKVPYYRGNVRAHEFHVAGCEFGDKVSEDHVRQFSTWQAAIAAGYNGCWTCQREFNVVQFADLRVEITDLDAFVPLTEELSVVAEYTGNARRFDVPLGPITEVPLKVDRRFDEASATYIALLRDLVPGPWTVTVTVTAAASTVTVTGPVAVHKQWFDAAHKRQGERTVVRVSLLANTVDVTYT